MIEKKIKTFQVYFKKKSIYSESDEDEETDRDESESPLEDESSLSPDGRAWAYC